MATQQNPTGPVSFGIGQIMHPTPQTIKNIRKGLNFFSGGVVTFLPTIAVWFNTSTDNLANIMGIVILGINTISSLFGVDPTESNARNFYNNSDNKYKPS